MFEHHSRARTWRAATIAALFIFALALRWFLDDSPIPNHEFPRADERHYIDLVRQLLNGRFAVQYFINPPLFAYVVAALTAATGAVRVLLGIDASFAGFVDAETLEPVVMVLTGRLVSMIASAASVVVVLRLGRRLFAGDGDGSVGTRIGLIAALALATDGVAIQRAALAGNESLMVLFVLLAVDALVTARDDRGTAAAWRPGLLLGLATATKYSAGILAIPLLFVLRRRALPGLVAAAASFLLGSASILASPRAFVSGFRTQASYLYEGFHDVDRTRGTPGWLEYLREFPEAHHGLFFAVVCAGALLTSLIVASRSRDRDLLLLLACVLPLYLLLGSGIFVAARFLLPAIPFLFLIAGWALTKGTDAAFSIARRAATRLRAVAPVLVGAALVLPAAAGNVSSMREMHGSAATLAPFCRFAAADIGPGDRAVEFSYPARHRLFADDDPWALCGLPAPDEARRARASRILADRGAPPRTIDLLELLPRCATLDDLRAEFRRRSVTKFVLQIPSALANDPRQIQRTLPSPSLRDCAYWSDLMAWLAEHPLTGPMRSRNGALEVAVIDLRETGR